MIYNTIMSCVRILDPVTNHVHLRQCFSLFHNRRAKMAVFSLPQIKYLAVFISVVAFSIILNPSSRYVIDPRSQLLSLTYFLSFCTHYGAQMFMTFVVGLLLFFNLPRIWFGHIQSKLFPLFFSCSFMLTSICVVTFIILNHYRLTEIQNQLFFFTVMLFSHGINAFVVSPAIIKTMNLRFEMEKESGKAFEVGFTDLTELIDSNPKYAKINRQFRKLHGLSGALNVLCLAFNTLHLYHISTVLFKGTCT